LSGGLDSSTLLAFCVSVLGSENVLAIIGDASYMISDEIEYAKNLSVKLGVCVQEIDVGLDEILNGNPSDRCYLCKFNIFSKARIEAEKKGFKYLFDGSNTDDLVEKRLGDKAKLQLNIESPFVVCNINKQKVRNLATELGLHERVNRASATCLMTRFKTGRAVSLSDLQIIQEAENFLKNLGFNLVRVRCFDSHYEIQTSVNDIGKLNSQEVWQKIKNYFQSKDINKVYPSSTGYKFGCMQEDM